MLSNQSVAWEEWEPAVVLEKFNPLEVKYSRGLLRADPQRLFPNIKNHWLPFFHSTAADLVVTRSEIRFEFPPTFERILAIEVDNEPGVIGIDESSENSLIYALIPQCPERARDIVIDYLLRRFLSSLARSWTAPVPMPFYAVNEENESEVEVTASFLLQMTINNAPVSFAVGVGSKVAERLDEAWRGSLSSKDESGGAKKMQVDLAEVLVPAELLAEYLRPGGVMNLEIPTKPLVAVRVDGKFLGNATLGQIGGRFGFKIKELQLRRNEQTSNVPGTKAVTKVRVELFKADLGNTTIGELRQIGAIFSSPHLLNTKVKLYIQDEMVGSALVGEINGKLALNILGKEEENE
jgi:flagellar motor switch/type III secretory pathway protein FliN